MYTSFFGLTKCPFSMAPDPNCVFLTEQHREAISGLIYAILDRKGYLVLTGEVGTGKTTALAAALQSVHSAQVRTSVIFNPTLTQGEFLELAMLDFGMTEIPASKAQRLRLLADFLVEGQRQGLISALVIDEAHKLSVELLEEVRLLGNFECNGEKLLQVILVGQNELTQVLERGDMRQLKQRVVVRVSLKPLTSAETRQYIAFRWVRAGGREETPFTRSALQAIGEASQGIPRLINAICDQALLIAFVEECRMVTDSHVREASVSLALKAPERGLHVVPPPPVTPEIVANGTAVAVRSATVEKIATEHSHLAEPQPGFRVVQAHPAETAFPLRTLEASYTRPSLWARWFGRLGMVAL